MDELARLRRQKAEKNAPSQITSLLYQYFSAATGTKFEWSGKPPRAVLIVTIDDHGSSAEFAGVLTKDDVRDAQIAIEDLIEPGCYERNKAAKEAEEKRVADYYATHTFRCSHPSCRAHFKTDAGRKIHERSCYHFKDDRRDAARVGGGEQRGDAHQRSLQPREIPL